MHSLLKSACFRCGCGDKQKALQGRTSCKRKASAAAPGAPQKVCRGPLFLIHVYASLALLVLLRWVVYSARVDPL